MQVHCSTVLAAVAAVAAVAADATAVSAVAAGAAVAAAVSSAATVAATLPGCGWAGSERPTFQAGRVPELPSGSVLR